MKKPKKILSNTPSKLRQLLKRNHESWRLQFRPRPKLCELIEQLVAANNFEIQLKNMIGIQIRYWQLCRPKAVVTLLRIIRDSTKTAQSTSDFCKLTASTAFRKQNSPTQHATLPLLTKSGKSKAIKHGVRSTTKAT